MLTPPRPGWITALRNQMRLCFENAPVASPKRWAAGQLGPSSMSVLCFIQRPVTPLPRRLAEDARRCRMFVAFGIVHRLRAGLGLPTAFQLTIAINPVTGECRGWRPAPARCRRAAKTRRVVIGMHGLAKACLIQSRRLPSRLHKPSSGMAEMQTSGFSDSFKHRSPPYPLCAAGQ